MAIYEYERRKKGYSLEGGKFNIMDGKNVVEKKPNASALEKAGLTNKDPKKDAQKSFKLAEEVTKDPEQLKEEAKGK